MPLDPQLATNIEDLPLWDDAFRDELKTLLRWRRDVRHFKPDPLPPDQIDRLIEAACLAPSVGNAQPWRFVVVNDADCRSRILADHLGENAIAANAYEPDTAIAYRQLKLSGLLEAPVHLAVFCDEHVGEGKGLGRQTMPEMLRYSVVCAIHSLWLAARSEGVGVGWVSILNPHVVSHVLTVPDTWSLIAYLCIGRPATITPRPELDRLGWQKRLEWKKFVVVK